MRRRGGLKDDLPGGRMKADGRGDVPLARMPAAGDAVETGVPASA